MQNKPKKTNSNFMKGLMICLSLALVLGFSFTTWAQEYFTDIDDSYAEDEIKELYREDIIEGYEDGTFRPEETMTRAEFASVLKDAMGLEPNAELAAEEFDDISMDDPYAGSIGALLERDLTAGTAENLYSPHKEVTREQLTTFYIRAFGVDHVTDEVDIRVDFTDYDDISNWAEPPINLAYGMNYISGIEVEDGVYEFWPRISAERQTISSFTYEYYFNRDIYLSNLREVVDIEERVAGTIEEITPEGELVLDSGVRYEISEDLQDTVLSGDNEKILAGSEITFLHHIEKVTEIEGLVLDGEGEGETFAGKDGELTDKLVVEINNLEINDLEVDGDMVIAEKVEDEFTGSNIIVEGATEVKGGSPDTISFEDSNLNELNIARDEVKVQVTGDSSVYRANIESDAAEFNTGEGTEVISVGVEADETVISGDGEVEEVSVEKEDVKVNLETTTEIERVAVNEENVTIESTTEIAEYQIDYEVDLYYEEDDEMVQETIYDDVYGDAASLPETQIY